MRVGAIVEQLLSPVPGGTGRVARELAAALAARDGVDVTGWVGRTRRSTGAARISGVAGPEQLLLPRPVLNQLWSRGLAGQVRPAAADVVLAFTPFCPPRARTPTVAMVHDVVPWTAPETMTPRSLAWHRRAIALLARTADAIVVPTQAVADQLPDHVRLKAQPTVIGGGVSRSTATVPSDADERARKLQLPQRYLLTVATLEPRKGLDIALRALADERTGDVPLLVAGQPGWGGIDLAAEARTFGLAPGRVRALGLLDDADLATAYAKAAAVLVPSRDEGFGLPAAEAMAHGLPVLVSSAPTLVEVVGDGGIVTPRGDRLALAAAIADVLAWTPEQRNAQATKAKARAADHTWPAVAERLHAVLARVV